jgi:hypothetical protein
LSIGMTRTYYGEASAEGEVVIVDKGGKTSSALVAGPSEITAENRKSAAKRRETLVEVSRMKLTYAS